MAQVLPAWISSTFDQDQKTVGYLGGNAVTMLNFMKESFAGADFQRVVLRGANLRRADCRGHASKANLDDANLSECDLTEADLTDVIWSVAQIAVAL